jgi:superfamily II DNA helicase RecQ
MLRCKAAAQAEQGPLRAAAASFAYREQPPGSCGIVYVLSRSETEEVAAYLTQHGGISAAHYHAGMTPKQRTRVQNEWRAGNVQVDSRASPRALLPCCYTD